MPIRVACPSCGHVLKAPDTAAGKRGKCGQCGTPVHIPTAGPPVPAPLPPPTPVPPSAPNPNTGPVPARVVKAQPLPTTKRTDEYDLEIEDEAPPAPARPVPAPRAAEVFDVEVEDAPSPLPKQVPDPAPRSVPLPPPVSPPVLAPIDNNPRASLPPPPDSAAAKLKSGPVEELDTEPDPVRVPLHPGWRSVASGLGTLKQATFVSFVTILFLGLAFATSLVLIGWVPILVLGVAILFSLVSTVLLVLGLVRCLQMPEPEDGGKGQQLVVWALIATGASVVCGLPGLAVPFLLAAFLRAIGQVLPSPPTVQAAMRFLWAAIASIAVSVLAPVANFAVVATVAASGGTADTAMILALMVLGLSLLVTMLALMMYLSALSTAETAILVQIRSRGVSQTARTKRPRGEEFEEADEVEPTPTRPGTRKPAQTDDYNPFA